MNETTIKPAFGTTNPAPHEHQRIKRCSAVIGLKPDKEQYYRDLHADVWPSIVARLKRSHIQNYSIHLTELAGRKYLISYFEYTGSDYESDMAAIKADPETQRWWLETDPCQIFLPEATPGAKWQELELVFLME